jgi:hypothetical protein
MTAQTLKDAAEVRQFVADRLGCGTDLTDAFYAHLPSLVLRKPLMAFDKMPFQPLATGYTASPSRSNAFCCTGVGRVTTVSG